MREDGIGSDAGRQSLTEVGAAAARALTPATCRLCGVACAAGTKFCPNCGAIQRSAGPAVDSRAQASGPLPPLPPRRSSRNPAAAAQAPTPRAETPVRSIPSRTVAPAGRGERLVAWSALGVLMIAASLVVQRVADLPGESVPARQAPVAIATAPEPLPSAPAAVEASSAPPAATSAAPSPEITSTREAIAAARQAAKPVAKPAPRVYRKGPPRDVARPGPIEAAPMPASPRPETVLVAQVSTEGASRTRWDSMHDEIATCSSVDFIDGVMCRQRVRIRYCTGWWGQSRDCPSRRDEYGN